MKSTFGWIVVSFAALLHAAKPSAASVKSAKDEAWVERIIDQHLMKHPEIVLKALQAAQEQEHQKRIQQAENYIQSHRQEWTQWIQPYQLGHQEPAVTIVEFLDYQCGHCRAMYQELQAWKDPRMGYAYVQLPILGPASMQAAALALSATPEQFPAVNDALFALEGNLEDKALSDLAKNLQIKRLTDAQVQEKLQATFTWAMHLGIQGAPVIVLTSPKQVKVFFGRIERPVLEEAVQALLDEQKV